MMDNGSRCGLIGIAGPELDAIITWVLARLLPFKLLAVIS
jgi:hypothetical protein